MKVVSQMSDGNGGGSATFAQGGGKSAERIKDVIEYVVNELKNAK